jgi:hypothetical protein
MGDLKERVNKTLQKIEREGRLEGIKWGAESMLEIAKDKGFITDKQEKELKESMKNILEITKMALKAGLTDIQDYINE